MGHTLIIIVMQNLFFIGLYKIDMISFIYLYYLNIDIMHIVLTQMSYVYSYCLYTNVVCLFVLSTYENHTHKFCV